MRIKKVITRIVIMFLIAILGIGTTASKAMNTYDEDKAKTLKLSYFRYVNGGYTNGYALNTTGNEGESHHPIYQIISENNETNYYCLNATAGETWTNGTVGTSVSYNMSYDLNTTSDIELLKSDTNSTYSSIGNSSYLTQILWILDNIYVPDTSASESDNLKSKLELLAKAGIVYQALDAYDLISKNQLEGYTYVEQTGYEYSDYTTYFNSTNGAGYNYYDESGNWQTVVISDDIVEVAQQAALWYFTNYKENNTESSETYNVSKMLLTLVCSNGTENTNTSQWISLENETFDEKTETDNVNAKVGAWEQEQAAVLCSYLIDAANNYATSGSTTTGTPVAMESTTTSVTEQTVGSTSYYVVGPIKINETRTSVYELDDTITVNESESTGAYISDSSGNQETSQIVGDYVGTEFYIAIPTANISGNDIKISFTGKYNTNEKILWVSSTQTEQPVVEVTPTEADIDLNVTAEIEENKEFDLALRKTITKLTDSTGTTKYITNEDGKLATRTINYVATDIANNGTATYNHRKDPVVVESGDIITYSITIYNEGDMAGYAKEIVDMLPEGLALKGYTSNGTTEGTYTSGSVTYTYVYDATKNTITFTNVTNNILNAYEGDDSLSSETIEIECEVTATPSSSTNKYLTNIAYISSEYNSDTGVDVETDRDSSTSNYPSANQETTEDSYTGYHGGDNNNGDNTKDVYNDGTNNDDYFPGREDDDDFEVVVVEKAEFDLALQKYISSIYSDGTTKTGRSAPTVVTDDLKSGNATTATYTQDKTPIQVKHGDYVTYTLTVYNEGDLSGYVNKITDNIPVGLQFVYADSSNDGKTIVVCESDGTMSTMEVDEDTYKLIVNNNSYWSIDADTDSSLHTDTYNGETTISVTCDVKSYLGGTNTLLEAYDGGSTLSSVSVTLVLRVGAANGSDVTIRNEAAITEAEDTEGNIQDEDDLEDRDSQTDVWEGKDGEKKYQDDEDYDNIILGEVDIALTKFITAVSDDTTIEDGEYLTADTTGTNAGSESNPYTRATKVDTTELRDNDECHDATYTMVKTPLTVAAQSYVLYNIRIYNEGSVDVYAGEVTDYLPDYLDYVYCDFNTAYGWTVDSDGKTIRTNYLSYENGEQNLLAAFDKTTDDGAGSGLDYRDIQILCRVNDNAPTNTNIVNVAEITEYQDEDGEDLPNDIDSTPDNVDQYDEDDDDYEVVLIQTFDLSLLKYVSTVYVTEDGVTTTTETGNTGADTDTIPKVEINRKKIDTTVVKFGYTIKITNEGDIAGYAKEITDYVPEGLQFYAEDNTGWTDEGNNVISTRLLENTLLQPGESATVTVVLRWINGSTNLGLKTNTAEISEDYNEEGIPDKDSTPDNLDPDEDDIDDAQVLLSISTGLMDNIIEYMSIGTIILVVLGAGIVVIKKIVLQ